MKRIVFISAVLGMVVSDISCRKLLPPAQPSEEILAEPLQGLTPEQLYLFSLGDGNFAHVFSREDGLGPIFVQTSCENCHAGDGKGNPANNVTRFGKYNNGIWDPMILQGGPQLQQRAITGYQPETLPAGATSVSLLPPSVTGLGFIEHLTDSALLALSDSADSNSDGISGRINWVDPPPYFIPRPDHISQNGKYIGRFGRKASSINLIHRVTDAYHDDIGITTVNSPIDPLNMTVSGLNGDNIADPEISSATLLQTVFYMRTLKNPPRRNINDPDVITGESVFINTGCVKCHVQTLQTGPSEIEPLNNKIFHPYSDFLLHDMGPDLDAGYTEGSASSSEWRTPPLWGEGLQENSQGGKLFLLHDGRARTFGEAISYHGGEAAGVRVAYQSLSETEKQKLILFLQSL